MQGGPGTMLRKSNVDLQWRAWSDDEVRAMSGSRLEMQQISANGPSGEGAALSIGQLAHELNSLLDGSIRCLALAERALGEHHSRSPVSTQTAGDTAEEAAARLKTAQESMRQMARLLQRAMANVRPGMELFSEREPLEKQVRQILELVTPLAEEHRVHLTAEITPKAASIPAATLGAVIHNGLRNAIQACAGDSLIDRRVELSIAITTADELMIVIADTGRGVDLSEHASSKPDGHGYGLELSRQIVTELGGELRLMNVPFGSGAVLQVIVPIRRLMSHG